MSGKHTILLGVVFLLAACAPVNSPVIRGQFPQAQSSPVERKASASLRHQPQTTYTVQKGDSLWSISKRYYTSTAAILAVNSGLDMNNLLIGQKINIPQSRKAGSSSLFQYPIQGKILNAFGERVDGVINQGVNFIAEQANSDVFAVSEGKVLFASDVKGWGKTVIIAHNQDIHTVYANLESIFVKEAEYVRKGKTIAKVAAGKNKNYVLHFEIRKHAVPQNPLQYLN